ncbi:hypothetical protein [Clostridium sp. 'White wine YQ']|uniref:hypothetical protein n=1 Tax=Clostridium sp. 'White wine YQ' TaxID=3027474 RepID=UPI002366E0D5|nr:hypothetical protein [Clostridium sp. 'White wine YQ']MDD7793667.1 hypothetical protein [Clostridium sp. 'White wine YQ']
MIFCRVDKCPVDGRDLCCLHCSKSNLCIEGCKRENSACYIKDKKRAPEGAIKSVKVCNLRIKQNKKEFKNNIENGQVYSEQEGLNIEIKPMGIRMKLEEV